MTVALMTRDDVEEFLDRKLTATRGNREPTVSTPKEWLSNKELLSFLSVSRATAQRLRRSGELPYSKINGSIYYKRLDVLDLLERNRRSK